MGADANVARQQPSARANPHPTTRVTTAHHGLDESGSERRSAILRVHIQKIQIDPTLDLDDLAALTPGFTGADLANLVNEAAPVATRRSADRVLRDDFARVIERLKRSVEHTLQRLQDRH